jgi:hypothetical protein
MACPECYPEASKIGSKTVDKYIETHNARVREPEVDYLQGISSFVMNQGEKLNYARTVAANKHTPNVNWLEWTRNRMEYYHQNNLKAVMVHDNHMVHLYTNLPQLTDWSEGELDRLRYVARDMGDQTLNNSLENLQFQKHWNPELIVTISSDFAKDSLLFTKYRPAPEGMDHADRAMIGNKYYAFAGNGGIIWHESLNQWSTHT